MNKDYFKSIPRGKEQIQQAYDSYRPTIQYLFDQVQTNYTIPNLIALQKYLNMQKHCKKLTDQHKRPIFQFILKKQLEIRTFIHKSSNVALRLVNLTKVYMKDFYLDWRQIYEMFTKSQNQIPRRRSVILQCFFRMIRKYYDQNNAKQVIQHLATANIMGSENAYTYISLFINVGPETNQQTLKYLLDWIFQSYSRGQLKFDIFLNLFLSIMKNKNVIPFEQKHYDIFRKTILSALTNPSKENGGTDTRFSKENAILIYYMIGKKNPFSIDLLSKLFLVAKQNLNPFQKSTYGLIFIYTVIRWLCKRLQTQKNARKRLEKLKAKIAKNSEKNSAQFLEKLEDEQLSTPVVVPQSAQEITQEQQKRNQQNNQEEEQQENLQQDEQKQQLNEENLARQLVIEQQQIDTADEQARVTKYEKMLSNQITPQIIECLRQNIDEIFEDVFFVNSKKTVPEILRYIFLFFPEKAIKSFDLLDKASNIPHINDQALLLNIKVITQFMFNKGQQKEALKNITRIFNKVFQVRNISDAWDIYDMVYSKIPLLDEKDMKEVSESKKQYFNKQFEMEHDKFYQQYSQCVMEAFKRLLRQGEYFNEETRRKVSGTMYALVANSHPYFVKRLFKEVMELLMQNPNSFIFSLLDVYDGEVPQYYQKQLLNQIQDIQTTQRIEILEIKERIVIFLSSVMPFKQIKGFFRSLAKKNRFSSITYYIKSKFYLNNVYLPPNSSSLEYFQKNPKLTLMQTKNNESYNDTAKQIKQYYLELLDELDNLLGQPDLKDAAYKQIIKKVFENKQNIKNVEKRKTVSEILGILLKIWDSMQIMYIDAQKGIPSFHQFPQEQIISLAQPKFLKIAQKLLFNSELIQDAKIPSILSQMINLMAIKYIDHGKSEKQSESRANTQNNSRQIPQNKNIKSFITAYSCKLRVCLCAIMHNKNKDQRSKQLQEYQKLLILAPHNSNVSQTVKAIYFSGRITELSNWLIELFQMSTQMNNKFFQNRIHDILQATKVYGFQFSAKSLCKMIDSLTQIITNQDLKLRQTALKSLKHLCRMLQQVEKSVEDIKEINQQMEKYRNKQKLQILWVFQFYIAMFGIQQTQSRPIHFYSKAQKHQYRQHEYKTKKSQLFTQIMEPLVRQVEKLILSESRFIRRVSLYVYSTYHRKIKQIYGEKNQESIVNAQYKQKTLEQFLMTGYLHPQHYDIYIKQKSSKRKGGPYNTYQSKQKLQFPKESYKFLIENTENTQKFLKFYHLDMFSSVDQLMNMAQAIKSLDLNEIVIRAVDEKSNFVKINSFKTTRIQLMFGQRFFKYLFSTDAKNGYKFFLNTKDYILNILNDFESLDNQFLILTYCSTLLNSYQKTYETVGQNKQVEELLSKFFVALIQKASGIVFKKISSILFNKVQNKKSIKFIQTLLEGFLNNRQKVSRAAQLLLKIQSNNRKKLIQMLKILLNEKIQLENQFINRLINTIINFPQKIFIDKKTIEQTGILNIAALKENKQISEVTQNTYVANNRQFEEYFLNKMEEYIESGAIELIKTTYNLVNGAISDSNKAFETKQSIEFIVKLLSIGIKIINIKGQLQIDQKVLVSNVKSIISNPYKKQNFELIINCLIKGMDPNKKFCQLLQAVAQRPSNFFNIDQSLYFELIKKILTLRQNNNIFKQLLYILANFLVYNHKNFKEKLLPEIKEKPQRVLLLQAYVLGNRKLDKEFIEIILKQSEREKRNIWAKQLLVARGKKQFLDNQEDYQIWRQVKLVSNPYHYHA